MRRTPLAAGGRLARACLNERTRGGDAVRRAVQECPPGHPDVARALTFHGTWGTLHWHAALLDDLPEDLREEARLRRDAMLAQHLRVLSDLSLAQRALDPAGVRWLTFKGPVLSETAYPRSDLRSYGDLDLLVHPDDLRTAVEALLDAGWPVLDPVHDLRRRPVPGELHLRGPAGTAIDLHWHLLYHPYQQQRTTIDPRRVAAEPAHARLGRLAVPTLPVPDHLVHVATHAAMAGGHRLGWLADARGLAQHAEQDWDQVVRTARSWRVGRAVALVLARAARELDAPVAPVVLKALDPSASWRLADRLAARVAPVVGATEHKSLATRLARRSEDDPDGRGGSLLAVAVASARSRGAGAQRATGAVPARPSVTTAAPEDLRGYLDAVAAWRPAGS